MSYSVKVVNPKNKSDFVVNKLSYKGCFSGIEQLKEVLLSAFQDDFDSETTQVGYIQPGHGTRGRQLWIASDGDIEEMYSQCQGKKEILWFVKIDETVATTSDKPKPPKCPCPDTAKTDMVNQVMSEVEKIVVFLTEKHSKDYTVEQIRAWAHMVQMDKHLSYDEPPEKPFFKKKKVKNDKRPSQLSPK